MFIFAAQYDWHGIHFIQVLPLLLPVVLLPVTPMVVTHETTHLEILPFYTSGFV